MRMPISRVRRATRYAITASVAASLATELRLHLIEGRRETWLYHAISESELLGKSVTLVDKSSLAGLLDPSQRDGLLVDRVAARERHDEGQSGRTVTIQIGPVAPADRPDARAQARRSRSRSPRPESPRNRVDPSIWDAVGRVGRYSDSTQDYSLRVDIECLVDNPADVSNLRTRRTDRWPPPSGSLSSTTTGCCSARLTEWIRRRRRHRHGRGRHHLARAAHPPGVPGRRRAARPRPQGQHPDLAQDLDPQDDGRQGRADEHLLRAERRARGPRGRRARLPRQERGRRR